MSNGLSEKHPTVHTTTNHESGDSTSGSPSSPVTRSASYAQLIPEQPQKFPERTDSLRRSFSENVLANGVSTIEKRSSVNGDLSRSPSSKSTESTTSSRPLVAQFSLGDEHAVDESRLSSDVKGSEQAESWEPSSSYTSGGVDSKVVAEHRRAKHSVPGSFSKFARRRSWIGTSRSPSPSLNETREESSLIEGAHEQSWPLPDAHGVDVPIDSVGEPHTNGISRKTSPGSKKKKRPLSSLLGRDSFVEIPSIPPIPTSYSTDKLPSLRQKKSNLSEAPAVPRSISHEKLQGSGIESPRKKDELWSVFRNLDGDFSKFQSRPSTTKTVVVRSSLLPFLKHYADQSSISLLKPEDLDRRSVILNKWWTGLLEMLNGRYGESVSGNDRPAILEAVTALMVRPEWTASPPLGQGRNARGPRASLKSRSTTSLGSNMSDFLIDSVFHNIKNTFTQNLLAQMAYVVQKMSVRNVAASVVSFCGKATAYAFFYCEGIAAILVRLWAIPTSTLRRVLREYDLTGTDKLDAVCDRVCASYPSCIHPLAFRSLRSTARYLRSRPRLPIAIMSIPWHGPWVGRWAGKDTDLFFVFVKHFTDLVSRYMPDGIPLQEQIVAPAWALVQAQILAVMRNTVQRAGSFQRAELLQGKPQTHFEDMIGEADATATLLPIPPSGAARSMAENRIVMLLRDCLANSTLMTDQARAMFADVFNRLLKATARNTSIFDHNACFTLCDFLEEAMTILMRYHQTQIDWSFWFKVCKQMLLSQNSMTEVRLFAFLFSMWGSIVKDDEKRREICLDWLLSKDTFHAEFNHWCPMVRAFYMRLLVWKVARPSTEDSHLDCDIMQALYDRLEEAWQNFLFIQQNAESNGHPGFSTAPCSPAPSRQLLIVRDDIQAAPSGMFLSFEGILSSVENSKVNPYENHSSRHSSVLRRSIGSVAHDDARSPSPGGKKRWALLKSIIPFASPSSVPEHNISSKSNSSKLKSLAVPSLLDTGSLANDPRLAPYRTLSFKFSLEWVDKENHPSEGEQRLGRPKLPPLAAMYMKRQRPRGNLDRPHIVQGSMNSPSKYVGRAIAEWGLLITECTKFSERRRAEGVPSLHLVEVPSLSVAPFRKSQ